ncbi:MAG: serine/threonine-protein kinase [Gaiellaceae bacterium]
MSVDSTTLRRYRLDEVVGRGGMAVVYRGHDPELGRPVAVKMVAEHLAADPVLRERFLREARLAARLSHPNVVAVYDLGEEDGRPFIVMEFVEGETLAGRLRRDRRLEPAEALRLALQACDGLAHAHAAGCVHRDVKPANLLLRADGVLKVADFGIAHAAEATALTEIGSILGTAAYLSPEQARGGVPTPASDVYSLGVVVYELSRAGRPSGSTRSRSSAPWTRSRRRRSATSSRPCRPRSRPRSCARWRGSRSVVSPMH